MLNDKIYLPSQLINNNYRYYYNNNDIEIITNNNCYNNYNTTYCDCYYYSLDHNIITESFSCSGNNYNTNRISINTFTSDWHYRDDLLDIYGVTFLIILCCTMPLLLLWKVFRKRSF